MRAILCAVVMLLVSSATAAACMTRAECVGAKAGHCQYTDRAGERCWFAGKHFFVKKRQNNAPEPQPVPMPQPNPLTVWHEPPPVEPTPAEIVGDAFEAAAGR